jgi:integrator complex subunit 11
MHMGYTDARRFPDFTALSASKNFDGVLDLLVVSHFHLDHCGALPYFTEMCGYNGPIIMTHPTKMICPILLEDFRKITAERRGEQNFFTAAMIDACMRKVTAVDLGQEVAIDGKGTEILVKAYYAGHVLGAAMFHVKVGNESVLYTGDYNMTPDRHLGCAIVDRCEPDVLITESTYATTIRDSKRARERAFLKQVHHCVANGGKVLVPTFALGRVQELCVLIEAYWERAGLGEIPVYFTGGMAAVATRYYRQWLSWTNQSMLHAMLPSNPAKKEPFDFAHIKPFEKAFGDLPGPMVVFSTPGMLHSGMSLELFKKWCGDQRNMLIVPGYCVAGTVGAKVLAGERQITLQETRVRGTNLVTNDIVLDIALQVKNLSFSAHVDAKGILQLICQCRPKNVVLVHGEAGKMQILKERITQTFHIPVYDPANGHVLHIETLKNAPLFSSIVIDERYFAKRRRDIAEAAEAVVQAQAMPERDKVTALMRSAEIQGKMERIQFDGYLHWSPPQDKAHGLQPPELLDIVSFATKLRHSPKEISEMRFFVRRFFKAQNLEAPNSRNNAKLPSPHSLSPKELVKDLERLNVLLIDTFHPHIAVTFDRAAVRLKVHSVLLSDCNETDPSESFSTQPAVIIEDFAQITATHIAYAMRWCLAGEKIAKTILRLFKERLE